MFFNMGLIYLVPLAYSDTPILTFIGQSSCEALQGFWGFRVFSGIWGEGSFIFRNLGRKPSFREQGAEEKTFKGAGEKGHFSFREQGAKTPPGGGGPQLQRRRRTSPLG